MLENLLLQAMPESETLCSPSVLAEEPAQAWVRLQAEDTRGRRPEQVPFRKSNLCYAAGCHAITTNYDVHVKFVAVLNSGRSPKLGFEGGQTPLRLRIGKRGFTNP